MSANPQPPHDSEEADSYAAGDSIYFLRNGEVASKLTSISSGTDSPSIGRWRAGVVVGPGGSSDDSPRYMVCRQPLRSSSTLISTLLTFLKVKDPSRDGAYRIDACDMRK